jgi:hypothetical protein
LTPLISVVESTSMFVDGHREQQLLSLVDCRIVIMMINDYDYRAT